MYNHIYRDNASSLQGHGRVCHPPAGPDSPRQACGPLALKPSALLALPECVCRVCVCVRVCK